jgi:hypothetical protein
VVSSSWHLFGIFLKSSFHKSTRSFLGTLGWTAYIILILALRGVVGLVVAL